MITGRVKPTSRSSTTFPLLCSRFDQCPELIREVEERLGDSKAILERVRPKFDEEEVKTVPQGKSSLREQIELTMDLIALAFQTDMPRW